MKRVVKSVEELEKKLPRRRHFFREASRAHSIAEDIAQLVQIVRGMSCQLNEMNHRLKDIAQRNDVFSPDFSSVPNVRVPVHLDFSTGCTMEGKLKATLLESIKHSSGNVENVHAHLTAVVGVAGMGGVGKTTALIGLAKDADIREKFSTGGIYFLVVGKDATPTNLVASLKRIVRRSGGKRLSEEIDSGSLESAVMTTSSWFSGRKALFILDDLWQTSANDMGYFNELIGLLGDSPESHVIISTRSNLIAWETGARIEFYPREKAGSEARGMFLASAGLSEAKIVEGTCEELLGQVLGLCGGVPLMLSIAGAQIRRRKGPPKASLEGLIYSLSHGRLSLQERQPTQYPSCFNQAVRASLNAIPAVLESSEEFMNPWNEHCTDNCATPGGRVADFVCDCYLRLCILPRSARVSEEVIFGIWCMTNERLCWRVIDCLVDFHLLLEFEDTQGRPKFGLHDVLLDYCEQKSRTGRSPKHELYHGEFLNHAWKLCYQESSGASGNEETWDDCDEALTRFWVPEVCERTRPWWKISPSSEELSELEDYLLQHLFRHLTECGRLTEAVGLLLRMGWTGLRVKQGGLNALNAEFSLVTNAIRSLRVKEPEACDRALQGIMRIWNMVGKAWPLILKNSEGLPTNAYGYLLNEEDKLKVVEQYLDSAGDVVSGPWLKPKRAFWDMLEPSGNLRIFRAFEEVVSIAMESKNIIVATKNMLFWVDRETMTATREMVIRKEAEITAISLCEPRNILVLGFHTGELELRNLQNGSTLREIPGAHERPVTNVALSANGRTMVSGSKDNTVRLWDTGSGSRIGHPLRGHDGSVQSVGISADGRTVVSGSRDSTVRLWDVVSGSQIGQPLRGHDHSVQSVGISADGRTAVSGSRDKTVRLWDVGSGLQIGQPFHGHNNWVESVRISANGRTVVSGSRDNTVRLWDVGSGSQISKCLRGHIHWVESVEISADGRTVVSSSRDKTVRLCDIRSGSQIGHPLHGHDDSVKSVAVSADGRVVVCGSEDNIVRLWDVRSGSQIGQPLHGHNHRVRSVGISADGRTAVSGSWDKTIRLWDVRSGSQIGHPLRGHKHWVRSVAISADNQMVVSGSRDKTVRLWDMESGLQIGPPLRGHEDWVESVAISTDGRTVASGSRDKTVRLWDVEKRITN